MNKKEIKRIFNAGRHSVTSKYTFEKWYETYDISVEEIASFYEICFKSVLDMKASKCLNRRLGFCSELKHIIRHVVYTKLDHITYEIISEAERLAGSHKSPHHSTIVNSMKEVSNGNVSDVLLKRVQKLSKQYL